MTAAGLLIVCPTVKLCSWNPPPWGCLRISATFRKAWFCRNPLLPFRPCRGIMNYRPSNVVGWTCGRRKRSALFTGTASIFSMSYSMCPIMTWPLNIRCIRREKLCVAWSRRRLRALCSPTVPRLSFARKWHRWAVLPVPIRAMRQGTPPTMRWERTDGGMVTRSPACSVRETRAGC